MFDLVLLPPATIKSSPSGIVHAYVLFIARWPPLRQPKYNFDGVALLDRQNYHLQFQGVEHPYQSNSATERIHPKQLWDNALSFQPPTCTFYEAGTSRTTRPQITALTAMQYRLICSSLRAHSALLDMARIKIRDVNTSGPSKRHFFPAFC